MSKHWEINRRDYGTVLTVLHDWNLDIANEFLEFSESVFKPQEHQNFIFDLHLVNQIDSMVMGIFISISKRIKKNGGQVFMLKPSKAVESLLSDIGLISYFNIFYSLEDILSHINNNQ